MVLFPRESGSFTLYETSFYTKGVARDVLGVLEGLSRFIVGFDLKDRFCFESCSFETKEMAPLGVIPWYLSCTLLEQMPHFMLHGHFTSFPCTLISA